ncbi:hypothetical protein SAMN05216315_13027 [Nitrosospira sp. Nsp18]|nr:hypothetical protein SAMN05216315_13027 [Nitrosospira sp. Nsp18]
MHLNAPDIDSLARKTLRFGLHHLRSAEFTVLLVLN